MVDRITLAGIIALVLEAKPELTWRDVQHIIVRTARRANLRAEDWRQNGAGYNLSHAFGFGLMDAGAMVRLATTWQTVPDQERWVCCGGAVAVVVLLTTPVFEENVFLKDNNLTS